MIACFGIASAKSLKNARSADSTVETSTERSRYLFPRSHEVSGTNRQAWQAAPWSVRLSRYGWCSAHSGSEVQRRIASNACIDELRRRQRHPQVSIDYRRNSDESEQPYDVPDDVPGPEDLALRGELRSALQAELLHLPDDQRLAVILCDIEGLAYEEIASAMGTSVGTVKSRSSRAHKRLAIALAHLQAAQPAANQSAIPPVLIDEERR